MSLSKRTQKKTSKRRSQSSRKAPQRKTTKTFHPEAWQVPKSKMLKDSEYWARMFEPYRGKSSRTTPMEPLGIKIGTWKYGDKYKGSDGYSVEQLRLFHPRELLPSEGENRDIETYRAEYGKQPDVERYVKWIKGGKTPPPIQVLELKSGGLRVTDGHRRWAAALKTNTKIQAWVSPLIEVKRDGYTTKVTLTHELAIKQALERGEKIPEAVLRESDDTWQAQFKWVQTKDRILWKDAAWWRWMGLSRPRSGQIKIYRGVSKKKGTWADEIREGDWVTLSKKQAKEMYAFTPDSKVLEKTVPINHVVEASTNHPKFSRVLLCA